MLICIYQSKNISVFSLILFLYYFHFTVHTLFQFFLKFPLFFLPFYSLQKPVTLTWHCWFCFHLSACIPACHAESNHIICNMCWAELKQGLETGYMWVETLTCISLLSVLTVTEEVRTHCFYSFTVLINCMIVSVRYYQCMSVLTVTEEFLLAKYSKFLIPSVPILTL